MTIDERLIGALHIQSGAAAELGAEEGPHTVFQASTVAALLDGAYDGDVSIGELAEHGDHGLGTLNGCDGELIVIDGRFLRADADGDITEVPPQARTPFAVLTSLDPAHRLTLSDPLARDDLFALLDSQVGHPEIVHALRIDGRFARVHARSIPKQSRPYRSLVEVVADQHVFDFTEVEGSVVGFRFPEREEGLNVAGYHLHFVTADRARGGHVLDLAIDSGTVLVDDAVEVHVELPPGVALGGGGDDDALDRVEHSG